MKIHITNPGAKGGAKRAAPKASARVTAKAGQKKRAATKRATVSQKRAQTASKNRGPVSPPPVWRHNPILPVLTGDFPTFAVRKHPMQ